MWPGSLQNSDHKTCTSFRFLRLQTKTVVTERWYPVMKFTEQDFILQ